MKPLDATKVPLEGTLLVEASAGTGKTYTITTLFVRLVVEEGLSVREIAVVTFTEAATAELRGRIRARLREALAAFVSPNDVRADDLGAIVRTSTDHAQARQRLECALSELDLAAVSTIHAFCLRVLQERAFESGAQFDLELMTDGSELVREVTEDFWASRMVPMAPDLFRMRKKDFGLDVARQLVDTFTRRPPDLPVLPAKVPPDPESLREQLVAAHGAASQTWRRANDDLRELIKSAQLRRSGPHGYPVLQLDPWCDELDDFFAAATPAFCASKALEKMTNRELAEGALQNESPPQHLFFGQAQKLFDLSSTAQSRLVLGLKRGAVDYARREMPLRKRRRGAQGFEDLLFSLDRALAGPRGAALASVLRGQFRAALIDEFQDTDPVQFRIFRTIFHGSRTLLLVGDPKQSIYAFRGADVFSYIMAAKDAGAAAYTLGTNHRSDPSLVKAVNTLFARAKAPVFVLPQIGFQAVTAWAAADRIALPKGHAAFEVLFLPRAPGQKQHTKGAIEGVLLPGVVATEIARFLGSGAKIEGKRVVAGDIAVLTRTNDQARWMQEALRKLGIPTALESEASVFESTEAVEVEQLLRAVLEPTRAPLVKTALATSIVGLCADEIAALETDEAGWQHWSDRLRDMQDDWSQSGFIQAYRRMLTSLGVEGRLLSYVDGERRITNLLHLGELLHLASVTERLGPTGTVRWLGARRGEGPARGALGSEAGELRIESDARSVKILTVHKSKGLEYPVVYCPFLWALKVMVDDVCTAFHDPADGERLKIHLDPASSPVAQSVAETEQRAENMRLLYVALTRAKHRCSIVWGGINLAESTPLACTLHPQRADVPASELTDAELRADLVALVKAAGGTISVRDLLAGDAPAYVPEEPLTVELRTRTYDRNVDTWWRIGSFSALTSGERAETLPDEARDRDEVDESTSLPTPTDTDERVILDEFPRGTKPGLLLHSVLENHDFTSVDPAALEGLVRRSLSSYGYLQEGLDTMLVRGLEAMLQTPLDHDGLTLRAVPRSKRLDELEFMLPVAQDRGEVTAKRIADAFAKHPSSQIPASYVDQLRTLRFLPLRGFLRGFVDLVFEHEGRFYVVDYKSNHLGSSPGDYAPACLLAAMADKDYYLQAHLYVVAVDRWLRRSMRGYDYEKSFGGVLYLFARGMSPAHPPGTGVFFDRPTPSFVRALSEVLDG